MISGKETVCQARNKNVETLAETLQSFLSRRVLDGCRNVRVFAWGDAVRLEGQVRSLYELSIINQYGEQFSRRHNVRIVNVLDTMVE